MNPLILSSYRFNSTTTVVLHGWLNNLRRLICYKAKELNLITSRKAWTYSFLSYEKQKGRWKPLAWSVHYEVRPEFVHSCCHVFSYPKHAPSRGCDIRTIFKRNTTGLNSKLPTSWTRLNNQSCKTILPLLVGFIPFQREIAVCKIQHSRSGFELRSPGPFSVMITTSSSPIDIL